MTSIPQPLTRFSKPLSAVRWFQGDATQQETVLHQRQNAVERALADEPHNNQCLICMTRQDWTANFRRNGLTYGFCERCGHVNIDRRPSAAFLTGTYASDTSAVYGDEFTAGKMADDYWDVVDAIYVPKAQFLADVLEAEGAGDTPILDFGCGSGHFMQALIKVGFTSVCGVETMPKAVAAASHAGLAGKVRLVSPREYLHILGATDAAVVSMMCVLPHLPNPAAAIASMAGNRNVKYTYQKLPMWSVATMIEVGTPNRRARVLGQDHTNVFTRQSLGWLEANVPMRLAGEWWFGQDVMDLVRRAALSGTDAFGERVLAAVSDELDVLQAGVDAARLSSELHGVWAF